MRFVPKYKIFTQSNTLLSSIPLRVLKFRRPKWKRLQKLILLRKKKIGFFKDNSTLKVKFKSWDRIRNYYKGGLKLKHNFYQLFDSSITKLSIKKNFFSKKNLITRQKFINSLIKPEFKIDILLWRLNFFRSSYQARQSVNDGEIFLNFKNTIRSNITLQKGDIITFRPKKSLLNFETNAILKSMYSSKQFPTFLEVDYYTNSIVILKNFDELSSDDFRILIRHYFDLKKFNDYL